MHRHTLLAAFATITLGATQAHAQARAPWLTGCWALRDARGLVEENWTSTEAGIMLGVSRTVKGGKMTEYEFVVLRPKGESLEYGVRLGDKPQVVFTATTSTATEIVFENSAHDFPKRVGYRLAGNDSLEAWIDGGAASKGPRIAYAYHRVTCGKP